jgi:hypothetical protein
MSVLIDARRPLAQQQITNLAKTREAIAERLEVLHQAVVALSGEQHGPHGIDDLLANRNSKVIEKRAIKMWLSSVGAAGLPLTDAALHNAFIRPKELNNLISAANGASGLSEDLTRYWQDGKFRTLPVTDDEKEKIYERAELRTRDKESAEMYLHLRDYARLATIAARENSDLYSSGRVRGADPVYGLFLKQNEDGAYEVLPHHFTLPTSDYRAFDEG